MTYHSYFNLDGLQGSVEYQELTVFSDKLLETDVDSIPTGSFIDTKNYYLDFNTPKKCPTSIDNTYVIENNNLVAASLYSSKNNLKMDVITNQHGVHIYVGGNCFGILKGKEEVDYHPLRGRCFETQNYPDAPNHLHFPSAVLKKGDQYYHKTIYKFQFV
ncbi:aldose epimerase family protein [Flavobacterium cellulosilyticum]|uniref:aldose epimerase family protein n=1 Tax=Flavobacterium cellulosilyticum TaxID=2541731 RepID=UPI001FE78E5B|nr:hypothetical protein [Flavobacterium cellulosilyticum]